MDSDADVIVVGLERDLELARRRGQVIPRLRKLPERMVLEAIALTGGVVGLRLVGSGEEYRQQQLQIVLRSLLRKGLIEVVRMGPAVYRVTRLGKLARLALGCDRGMVRG